MIVTFLKSATKLTELPRGKKPHIAFVGRSNVGKSTLLNDLAGKKGLAYVSSMPGRTQLINIFEVDHRFYLVDLPGYGYAKISHDKKQDFIRLLRTYLSETEELVLVFLVIDARQGLTELDQNMLAQLEGVEIPCAIIVNKMDKLSRSVGLALLKKISIEFPKHIVLSHSSVSGKGNGEIWETIEKSIRKGE
ncbi:YihA family ribosome biogenesis GTP-binding protein [Candidatus Uhrbacteria bacterium]|nr:YihA family ribosome biogenesis GTP-binding protein [Candidatus Uhrbacteria bacterium]